MQVSLISVMVYMAIACISTDGCKDLETNQPRLTYHMNGDKNQLSEAKQNNEFSEAKLNNEFSETKETNQSPEATLILSDANWVAGNASNLDMDLSITNDKRSIMINNRPQWKCYSQMNWRDLGAEIYPRFVQDYVCTQIPCVQGYYQCQPVYYPVRVFTRRNISEPVGEVDIHVPSEIRATWKSILVDVSVGCECKLPSGSISP